MSATTQALAILREFVEDVEVAYPNLKSQDKNEVNGASNELSEAWFDLFFTYHKARRLLEQLPE